MSRREMTLLACTMVATSTVTAVLVAVIIRLIGV